MAILQAFFPRLVAGPIVRANELLPQLRAPAIAVLAGPGLFLIVGGLIEKTVVADELARNIVDPCSTTRRPPASSAARDLRVRRSDLPATSRATPTWRSASRCCSGSSCCWNFNRPYLALSLQDFWRRWHDAVARSRDYLTIPLGSSRGGPHKTIRNLMLTMLLGGLWHGAAWTFVIWGGIHGTALSIEALEPRALPAASTSAWLAWLITFHVVCLAWIFFRSPDLSTAFAMIGQVFAGGPSPLVTLPVVFLVVATVGLQAVPGDFWGQAEAWLVARPVAVQGCCSARSWWPPAPPSARRAWPRSSTSSSEMEPRSRHP